MQPARAWLAATRPPTLIAAVAPVGVGVALAGTRGPVDMSLAALTLASALAIQIGTNLFNDYADFRRGADTGARLGPPRACAQGWLPPRHVRAGALLAFGLAALTGGWLVAAAGWPILAIGMLGIACGYAYTGGPLPLAYVGVADVFTLTFFGIVAVAGTAFVQLRQWLPEALLYGAGLGALATGMLAVNNLRDRDGDARAGKRTLAVRIGPRRMRRYVRALLAAAILLPMIAATVARAGALAVWLPLLALPPVLALGRAVGQRDGRELNGLLKGIAGLELALTVLIVCGLAWA